MKKFSLSFIFLIALTANLFSQNFYIKGNVISGLGNNTIEGASISLTPSSKITVTDVLGNFIFNGLTVGTYILKVNYIGYEKFEKTIVLNSNQEEKIILKAIPINISEVNINLGHSVTQTDMISAVDKQLRPVNTAQDLLRLVPGLFIAQHAGGGKAEQIFLRGFDCDHGTDFYISIDGMPVNMVSHAHGQGYADFHFVIPETVDKLKVYKGPYNAKFGDFSTSGSGEFITKNHIENNEVKAEVGLFNTYRVMTMINLLGNKHLFSKEKENAYVAGEYVFTNSYFDNKQNFGRLNLFGKYSGMLNKNNMLSFSASTFAAQWDASGQVPARAVKTGLIGRFGSIDPTEGGQTKRSNFNAALTTVLKNNAVLKNQFYYVNYYFNLFSNFTFFLLDSVHGDEINQTDKRNIFGYNGTYEKDFSILNKTVHSTAGIGTRNDYADIALRHAEKRVALDTVVYGVLKEHNINAYIDETIDLNQHLSINLGTRFDYFNFNFEDKMHDTASGTKNIARVSPKLNLYYALSKSVQFFIKSGLGFHSNDARAVVVNHVSNSLPKALGYEIGSEFKFYKKVLVNISLWGLDMQSELVYVGDEATVETSDPTRRLGVDLGVRYQLTTHLFADVDLNYSHGRLLGPPEGENYIPLAPSLTSIGGITYKREKGLNGSIRYRYIDSRPANENNTVTAKGYFILDAVANYKFKRFSVGLSAENLLNTTWNQAQFDTESRLKNETQSVSELHYTAGTPFYIKGIFSFVF